MEVLALECPMFYTPFGWFVAMRWSFSQSVAGHQKPSINTFYRKEGTTERRGRSHPPQCTTSWEDRKIVRSHITNRSTAH
ncbi:hypothetical protein TNCV_3043791 [Trichonephila clavipes]|nr:hypothetical protein TNCV_3043791 [Trichonephila clavipes]